MPVAHGAKHELRAATHAVSTARGFHIFVNRVTAEPQNLADLPVAFALRYQGNALDLSWAERDAGQWAITVIDQFAGAIERDGPEHSTPRRGRAA